METLTGLAPATLDGLILAGLRQARMPVEHGDIPRVCGLDRDHQVKDRQQSLDRLIARGLVAQRLCITGFPCLFTAEFELVPAGYKTHAASRQIATIDPLLNRNTLTYDAANNIVRTTNGSPTKVSATITPSGAYATLIPSGARYRPIHPLPA